jgi:transcriptional regulator with XRE-family HTH domain
MEPIDIQYQLKKLKITQGDVAKSIGVSQSAVSKVVNKQRISNRIMRRIAGLIGRDHTDVFPEYYKERQSPESKAA